MTAREFNLLERILERDANRGKVLWQCSLERVADKSSYAKRGVVWRFCELVWKEMRENEVEGLVFL